MVLCVIEAVVAITWMIIAKKHGVLKKKRMVPVILFLTAVLGILVDLSENRQSAIDEEKQIVRNEPGQGEKTEALEAEIPELEQSESYTVSITERQLTEEERKRVLDEAVKEAEQIFHGSNPSMEEVREAVVLPETLQDGLVQAEWNFDNYEVMQPDGKIQQENIPQEGILVQAKLHMSCQGTEQIYEFYFKVLPPQLSETEQFWEDLSSAIRAADEETSYSSYYTLPDSVDGHTVIWKEKQSKTAVTFAFLGVIAATALAFKDKENEKKRQELRENELLFTYPEMVNKLTLLLGAGMSMASAWEKIALTYKRQSEQGQVKKSPVYEEMLVAYHEMQDGIGERNAYLRFGERCGLTQYRKMVSLITQNVRKGQKELTKLLEDEADEAFHLRKELAKKAGEEAGTKLLMPMMIMLALVMAVILVPACMSFQL